MSHLDPGRILSLRDRPEVEDSEAREHLAACAACRAELERAGERERDLGAALARLDPDEPWDWVAARAAVHREVRARTAARRGAAGRRWISSWGFASLARAAGVLLVTAAAVGAAVPGSPLRAWLAERFQEAETAEPAAGAVDAVEAPAEADERTGVRLAVTDGALRVVLSGLGAGDDVRLRWVPGTEAGVIGPLGTRFSSGRGRLQAVLPRGPVEVEVPRSVSSLILEVGGRIYLRSSAGTLEVPGPVVERSDTEVLFRVPRF